MVLYEIYSKTYRRFGAHKTSLTPSLFIQLLVTRQESEWSCISMLGVSILPLSTILFFHFGIVQTVCYFFIFFFSFYYVKNHKFNLQCFRWLCFFFYLLWWSHNIFFYDKSIWIVFPECIFFLPIAWKQKSCLY